MQTFLPHPCLHETAKCLDYRRLGKQRVEAKSIVNILENNYNKGGWFHHPAVLMWSGFVPLLKLYFNIISEEWIKRGYKHNIGFFQVEDVEYPFWFGNEEFHSSHRAALLFKNPDWYSKFGWVEKPMINYWWPIQFKRVA